MTLNDELHEPNYTTLVLSQDYKRSPFQPRAPSQTKRRVIFAVVLLAAVGAAAAGAFLLTHKTSATPVTSSQQLNAAALDDYSLPATTAANPAYETLSALSRRKCHKKTASTTSTITSASTTTSTTGTITSITSSVAAAATSTTTKTAIASPDPYQNAYGNNPASAVVPPAAGSATPAPTTVYTTGSGSTGSGTLPVSGIYAITVLGSLESIQASTVYMRSSALNASIAADITSIQSNNPGISPYDATQWNDFGYYGAPAAVASNRRSTETIASGPAYGGPGAWCKPTANTTYSIPTTVPLPYQGTGATNGSSGTCTPFETNLAGRFETVTMDLPVEPHWNSCDVNDCACVDSDNTHFILPLSLQPNGGMQYAWKEKNMDIIHITYLDPSFKRVQPDIIVYARTLGGLTAFDDGTALLVGQVDCDGPSTADPNAQMVKAVLIYWESGNLIYAKRLTDPYRSNPQTEDYKEDATGMGDYIFTMDWATLVYDTTSDQFGVFFKVTGGRGGHWGSNAYQLARATGKVTSEINGCSHDIDGRLLADPSGKFPFLCVDDGFGIENPVINASGNRQLMPISSENSTPNGSAGWSPATLGSLIKRNGPSGFILAYLTKSGQDYYQIKFILFDSGMQKTVILPYTLSDPTANAALPTMEHFRLHLTPYGASGSETYMLFYTTTVMSTISCCTANVKLEDRCFGTIENKMYQIVSFKNDVFTALTNPTAYDMKMDSMTTPQVYANGDLLWAVIDNTNYPFYLQPKTSITFNRLKNCV